MAHALEEAAAAEGDHPRARPNTGPDPEALARDLEGLEADAQDAEELAGVRDRLAILEGRVPWVADRVRREWLTGRVAAVWKWVKR